VYDNDTYRKKRQSGQSGGTLGVADSDLGHTDLIQLSGITDNPKKDQTPLNVANGEHGTDTAGKGN
jgi:hypothetical protein